jgi:hypothetical protein
MAISKIGAFARFIRLDQINLRMVVYNLYEVRSTKFYISNFEADNCLSFCLNTSRTHHGWQCSKSTSFTKVHQKKGRKEFLFSLCNYFFTCSMSTIVVGYTAPTAHTRPANHSCHATNTYAKPHVHVEPTCGYLHIRCAR